MPTEIIMPKVDMVMETGTFVEWLKQEGQPVKKGEALFVIMTDKAAIECESPATGLLARASARPDDVIPVTNVIGYILGPGETLPDLSPLSSKTALPATPTPAKIEAALPASETSPKLATEPQNGERYLRATPLARQVAHDMGIDLASVTGHGPRGRIYKSDVLAAAEATAKESEIQKSVIAPVAQFIQPAGSVEMAIPLPNAAIRERIPLKGARAVIARRMAYSAATAPHINLGMNVQMSEVVRWRQKAGPKFEAIFQMKLSYTAILAYVVAHILPAHPFLNSSLADNEILLWEDVHLGIATALGDDLIVPVIRQAHKLSLEEIVKEMNRLLEAARAHKLQPSEMTGSTFTISNMGMFGIEDFTAIINPPEAAILAVGKMVDSPVVIDGVLSTQPTIHFTLGTDHRINDGIRVARFLNELKESLENPYLLL